MGTTAKRVSGKVLRTLVAVLFIVSVMMSLTGCFDPIEGKWEFYSMTYQGFTVTADDLSGTSTEMPTIEVKSSSLTLNSGSSKATGSWAKVSDGKYILKGSDGTCDIRLEDDYLILYNMNFTGEAQALKGVEMKFKKV